MCIGNKEWIKVQNLHFSTPKRKTSRVRVLGLMRRRWRDTGTKNLKLYIENIIILRQNERLRVQANFLHKENLALMVEFQKKVSQDAFMATRLQRFLYKSYCSM